ncbi:multicopper oxidase family protein [Micromonospora sp. NBC_01412]|uniref:multicopper oxidase family protein n=1 Tax=Micromonospora sp. NBC_01412 TaxID=2903590 RepID=UPI0032488222
MVSRRGLLIAGAAGGAAALTPAGWAVAGSRPAPPLDPRGIPKYVTPLPVPRTMPRDLGGPDADEYAVAVRQFRQQVLPRSLPPTTVWGFGSAAHPGSFRYPGPTIEARAGRPVRVTWLNQLLDRRGRHLPHLLPVDPTLHWANPAGGDEGRDHAGHFRRTPGPYLGPVPIVVHLHGGHNRQECDGHPEAWYLPSCRDLPSGYARYGSSYREFGDRYADYRGTRWSPGAATVEYANDQRATALWYHDHALGLTRLTMYAGPIGLYLLRGGDADLPPGVLPGAATGQPIGPAGGSARGHHEIPLVIQDRSFTADGSLHYPASRAEFDGRPGRYAPETDVPPMWHPAVFADTIVVNGRTWPVLEVERRRYRFRLLNGCNSRFLLLSVAAHPTVRPARPAVPFWQIGSDGGFLPAPVRLGKLPLGGGSRVDAVVDFSDVPAGTELYLVNEGPDGLPGRPEADFEPADPDTTGQVLKLVVTEATGPDRSVPPDQLDLPSSRPLGPAERVRRLSLNETMSTSPGAGPVAALLGTVDRDGRAVPLRWNAPVTETPRLYGTEVWEFHNFTPAAHPIHLHQVQFELVGRGPTGQQPPGPAERGWLDTVAVFPGEVTRIKARFDLPGRFAWHCHLLEHEDNEMMRPYDVVPSGGAPTGDGGIRAAGSSGLGLAGVAALGAAALGAGMLHGTRDPGSTSVG